MHIGRLYRNPKTATIKNNRVPLQCKRVKGRSGVETTVLYTNFTELTLTVFALTFWRYSPFDSHYIIKEVLLYGKHFMFIREIVFAY